MWFCVAQKYWQLTIDLILCSATKKRKKRKKKRTKVDCGVEILQAILGMRLLIRFWKRFSIEDNVHNFDGKPSPTRPPHHQVLLQDSKIHQRTDPSIEFSLKLKLTTDLQYQPTTLLRLHSTWLLLSKPTWHSTDRLNDRRSLPWRSQNMHLCRLYGMEVCCLVAITDWECCWFVWFTLYPVWNRNTLLPQCRTRGKPHFISLIQTMNLLPKYVYHHKYQTQKRCVLYRDMYSNQCRKYYCLNQFTDDANSVSKPTTTELALSIYQSIILSRSLRPMHEVMGSLNL